MCTVITRKMVVRKKNVISTLRKIDTGVISTTFSRRDIIEGYILGNLPMNQIVSKLDLHSDYSSVKVEIFKQDGAITHAKATFIK